MKKILASFLVVLSLSCGSPGSTHSATETSQRGGETDGSSLCSSRRGHPSVGKYKKGEKINLERFSERRSQYRIKEILRDPKTGEYLERDHARRKLGGGFYELKDRNGCKIATVSKDGIIGGMRE